MKKIFALDSSAELESHFSMKSVPQKQGMELSERILGDLYQYRRFSSENDCSSKAICPDCRNIWQVRIQKLVQESKAIVLILPAFPGKSPNLNKVLGYTPDMGEVLSLKFLNDLAANISSYYAPGVEIVICSDGRVFSDVVGMNEDHVTIYREQLKEIIKKSQYSHLSFYDLEDVYGNHDFEFMREQLMGQYSVSLDSLRESVKKGALESSALEFKNTHSMYLGITKFMLEDSLTPEQTLSKNQLQKNAKAKAYEVIRRSNAWSELLKDKFPDAIRLSIHPQSCGSEKIGIQLVGKEQWLTPWHGVVVEIDIVFKLMKKHEAIELGARLIQPSEGNAVYYKLNNIQTEVVL